LYIDVRENDEMRKLQNGFIALLMCSVSVHNRFMRVSRKHHMTIARNLNPIQFRSIACEYENRQINTSFKAKNIVMLKRPYDEYKTVNYRWQGSHNFIMGCS
jgi:hypothetical protein